MNIAIGVIVVTIIILIAATVAIKEGQFGRTEAMTAAQLEAEQEKIRKQMAEAEKARADLEAEVQRLEIEKEARIAQEEAKSSYMADELAMAVAEREESRKTKPVRWEQVYQLHLLGNANVNYNTNTAAIWSPSSRHSHQGDCRTLCERENNNGRQCVAWTWHHNTLEPDPNWRGRCHLIRDYDDIRQARFTKQSVWSGYKVKN